MNKIVNRTETFINKYKWEKYDDIALVTFKKDLNKLLQRVLGPITEVKYEGSSLEDRAKDWPENKEQDFLEITFSKEINEEPIIIQTSKKEFKNSFTLMLPWEDLANNIGLEYLVFMKKDWINDIFNR